MLQPSRAPPTGGDIDDDKYAKKQFRDKPIHAMISYLIAISLSLTFGYMGSIHTSNPKIASPGPVDEATVTF